MRIWVARPEPGAGRTGERIAAMGHVPLVAPVLVVRPTGSPLPAGPFEGLILTSANALAALLATTEADVLPGIDVLPRIDVFLGIDVLPGMDALRGIPVFAVGPHTAGLAAKARLGPVEVGTGDAFALAGLVRRRLRPGAHLLHVAGAEHKPEPAASLEAAGYRVETHVAYAAEALPHLPDRIAAALGATPPGLDAALHYSRRSATIALRLTEADGCGGAFRALRHYCLSGDVAVPLEVAGVAARFVAARPREDDLLAGLA